MQKMDGRSCATCVSFNRGQCSNGLGSVRLTEVCGDHKTLQQDRRDDEAMALFRVRLGLPPRKPWAREA